MPDRVHPRLRLPALPRGARMVGARVVLGFTSRRVAEVYARRLHRAGMAAKVEHVVRGRTLVFVGGARFEFSCSPFTLKLHPGTPPRVFRKGLKRLLEQAEKIARLGEASRVG